jgi:hypothetical protein
MQHTTLIVPAFTAVGRPTGRPGSKRRCPGPSRLGYRLGAARPTGPRPCATASTKHRVRCGWWPTASAAWRRFWRQAADRSGWPGSCWWRRPTRSVSRPRACVTPAPRQSSPAWHAGFHAALWGPQPGGGQHQRSMGAPVVGGLLGPVLGQPAREHRRAGHINVDSGHGPWPRGWHSSGRCRRAGRRPPWHHPMPLPVQ